MRCATLTLCLCLVACGGELRSEDPPTAHSGNRFEGLWMVDQPYHALYEATLYQLHGDGRLERDRTLTSEGLFPEFETGVVAGPESTPECRFGDAWRSPDPSTLIIETRCDDDASRALELGFQSPARQDYQGAQVEIRSVGGAQGWTHPGFEWRFIKCADPAACLGAWAFDVQATVREADIYFCECHHGYGPGLDGHVELVISNHAESAATVGVTELRVLPVGQRSGYLSNDPLRMRSRREGSSGVFATHEVEPWRVATLRLEVYIDTAEPVADAAGAHLIELDLEIDGELRTLRYGPVDLPFVPPEL